MTGFGRSESPAVENCVIMVHVDSRKKYPWDDWFAAKLFSLRRGEDFDGRVDSFIQYIRNVASDRGVGIRVQIQEGPPITVIVSVKEAKVRKQNPDAERLVRSRKGANKSDGPKSVSPSKSEAARNVRKLGNLKSRVFSQVIETSAVFSELDRSGQKVCSRMLKRAVQLLWERTGAGNVQANDFLDAHKSLLKCVIHIWEINRGWAISLLNLSPGNMSALMYLMATSGSDGIAYRDAAPPNEEACDLAAWRKAQDFFVQLAGVASSVCRECDGDDKDCGHCGGSGKLMPGDERAGNPNFFHVVDALHMFFNVDGETTENQVEKHAIIAKAWNVWSKCGKITEEDVTLMYAHKKADGVMRLAENTVVGGIDLGENSDGTPDGGIV